MTVVSAKGIALPGRLQPTDLALRAGEFTMLVGPNGAGKTSLLQALAGIGEASGAVTVEGNVLRHASLAHRRRLISYLGASRDLRWPLVAREYVALALGRGERSERANAALARASADVFADRSLDRLSTGERSRVMIARAIAPGARALLLDEPCANLDPRWQLAAIGLFKAEAATGAAVLLSIHDLALAYDYGDRIIVMADGAIVADGTPADALSEAVLADIFGVRRGDTGRLLPA